MYENEEEKVVEYVKQDVWSRKEKVLTFMPSARWVSFNLSYTQHCLVMKSDADFVALFKKYLITIKWAKKFNNDDKKASSVDVEFLPYWRYLELSNCWLSLETFPLNSMYKFFFVKQ